MKKITIITVLALTLILSGKISAEAFTGSRFINGYGVTGIDARDSLNRPAESSFVYMETVFSRIYSMISPLGAVHRVSLPLSQEKLLPGYNFNLPHLIFSFVPGREDLVSGTSKIVRHPMGAANIVLTASVMGAFMLLFFFKLPSKDEPRFWVPVFIE